MEILTKLLKDSYNLQEGNPEESAYWHLQMLRSAIKKLESTEPVDGVLADVVGQSEQFICPECKEQKYKWIDKCEECTLNEFN